MLALFIIRCARNVVTIPRKKNLNFFFQSKRFRQCELAEIQNCVLPMKPNSTFAKFFIISCLWADYPCLAFKKSCSAVRLHTFDTPSVPLHLCRDSAAELYLFEYLRTDGFTIDMRWTSAGYFYGETQLPLLHFETTSLHIRAQLTSRDSAAALCFYIAITVQEKIAIRRTTGEYLTNET